MCVYTSHSRVLWSWISTRPALCRYISKADWVPNHIRTLMTETADFCNHVFWPPGTSPSQRFYWFFMLWKQQDVCHFHSYNCWLMKDISYRIYSCVCDYIRTLTRQAPVNFHLVAKLREKHKFHASHPFVVLQCTKEFPLQEVCTFQRYQTISCYTIGTSVTLTL
jgi:hypothetical protein